MNFFYILSAKRVKQAIIILAASFFTAGIFYIEQGNIAPVFSTDNGPRVIYKGPKSGKTIALTFDITWGDTKALPIIDLLKKEGVQTTFFLSASWAERHPDIVKRIIDDGHEIGTMGYNYENYMDLEDAQIKKDIYRAQDVFKKLQVKTVNLIRTPDGNFDKRVVRVIDSIGYTVVHWGVDSNDWRNPGVQKITSNVLENIDGGDIVLFHASDSAKQTEVALPNIIKELKGKGYSFVTVSDLIANTKVQSKKVE
ncbi:polysaccharide deacetylase family sporulation protein PdaB [Ferdinandcohnia quinoae]|uniref:Polysaccharide deacetylase family sporulation protein PdaB n=1 Tax=Fredinandcohnia quinoae TaxID=2918902 RepID=A0AAW5E7P2_9BACI|nr:polysaccharide deacetylase family sporulation protein PdaB [Fredinandcohnia sp. SECRCQ15]MCH1626037.1 polysaccharide deacetylase family sporulation protein PdaB [Fredinandcohnia sp. SECRCQ15]